MSEHKFTIKPEYLTDVVVSFTHPISVSGITGTTSSVDHPAFAAMRKHMAAAGYIEIDTMCWNRDKVLKTFFLNDVEYKKGDRFTCASHQGTMENVRNKNSV